MAGTIKFIEACMYMKQQSFLREMQALNEVKRQESDNLEDLRLACSSLVKHESCCHCNGYYGPCFGEPLCATCHAFLYPPDPFKTDATLQLCDQKADECDSGNEEPRETQQDGVLLPRAEDNSVLFPYEDAEDFAVLSKQQYPIAFAADRSSEVTMYPPGDIVMMAAAVDPASAPADAQYVGSRKECEASSSSVQDVSLDSPPSSDPDTNDVEVQRTKYGAASLAGDNKIHCKCSASNLKEPPKKHSGCKNGARKKLSVDCKSVAGAAAAAIVGNNDMRPEAAGVSQELLQNLSLKDFDEMIVDLNDDANRDMRFFASQAVERLHNSLKEKSSVRYKAVQHNYFECSSEAYTEDGKNGCFSSKGVCQCYSTPNGYQLQERICLLTNFRRYTDTAPSELANMMPPEVWMLVFRRLDDVSLWQCSRVSASWRQMVLSNWGHDSWRRFTLNRWRFFRPLYTPVHWHALYTSLMKSSPCRLCHAQMLQPIDPSTLVEQKSWRMTRLRNENRNLMGDPPEGIEAVPLDPQCLRWQAAVRGPDQSPYQGGTFYLHILIPPRYPLGPPVVRFLTKIFHPNVSSHGDIGIDSIQHNWSLALTISKVLISIQSLLTDPYTKVCMQPLAGRLYDCDRTAFNTVAREWTWRYAMTDTLQPRPCADELTLCEAITTESFEENNLDDMSPILPTGEEEENNEQEQDNYQEQENNEHEPEINYHEQENNDQEQENNEQ